MHHWGYPLWVVVVEITLCGCCRGGCGRPRDVDHHADRLGGH
jgi:hypothetical protein